MKVIVDAILGYMGSIVNKEANRHGGFVDTNKDKMVRCIYCGTLVSKLNIDKHKKYCSFKENL